MGLWDMHRWCDHLFTAWQTVRVVLARGVEIVTLERSCCLCGHVETTLGQRVA